MLPAQLTAASFKSYPAKGQAQAVANLELLKDLPLAFVPFLLKDLKVFDWKFAYEQNEFISQLAYLTKLWPQRRKREMEPFAALKLNDKLEHLDWVTQPAQFMEQLSAHLWATQQMDAFRDASENYVRTFTGSLDPEKLPVPRLGVAVLGQGVSATQYRLFRKLRRNGVYYSRVNPAGGLEKIDAALQARAAAYPLPHAHWRIDGGSASPAPGFTCLGYDELKQVREKLTALMLAGYESAKFDPEELRTKLAAVTPESLGMKDSGDPALDRFALTLFTEGSGTQIYGTTFVQWAAREALRRAHPLTVCTRFTQRQKERTMNELLAGAAKASATDAEGSLIDADMGAYYTWMNFQRLPGADNIRFLAWFEGHGEAVAIAPGLAPGTEDAAPVDLSGLFAKLT